MSCEKQLYSLTYSSNDSISSRKICLYPPAKCVGSFISSTSTVTLDDMGYPLITEVIIK